MVQEHVRKTNLPDLDGTLLSTLFRHVPVVDVGGVHYIREDKFRGILSNVSDAIQRNDSSLLRRERGLRFGEVVSIQQFIEDPFYSDLGQSIRPAIKAELIRLFESGTYYTEVLLTGGIGTGKGYLAKACSLYTLYLISCLENPQVEYGIDQGASLYFVMQSRTELLAKKAMFDEFREAVRASPYFTNYFMYDKKIDSELRFPHHIYVRPFAGNDTACLGLNVVNAVVDEMNFMVRTSDSLHTRYTGGDEYDQAERVYVTLARRMDSRFKTQGRLPGKLILVSSSRYPGDFTDRRCEAAAKNPSIFVMRLATWESVPQDRFSEGRFYVERGTEYERSRIIDASSLEAAQAQSKRPDLVIEVPEDYREAFEQDCEGALRDLAGYATAVRHAFIPYRENITKAQRDYAAATGGKSLFLYNECVLEQVVGGVSPDYSALVSVDYLQDCLNRDDVFALHIDVGLSGDAAGMVLSRIVGYMKQEAAALPEHVSALGGDLTNQIRPIYQIDGAIRFLAGVGGQVDLNQLAAFVVWLKAVLNIRWGTADAFQSAALIQAMRSAKIRSGVLSVDQNLEPYYELRSAIADNRLRFSHPILAKELLSLERYQDRVDHPPGGSKDIADAAAGSIYMLFSRETKYGRPRSSGTRIDRLERAKKVRADKEAAGQRRSRTTIRRVRLV